MPKRRSAPTRPILSAVIDQRPSGTRQRLADALGKNRSFVTQITSPAYSTPIPAKHLPADLLESATSARQERDLSSTPISVAHPGKAQLAESGRRSRAISRSPCPISATTSRTPRSTAPSTNSFTASAASPARAADARPGRRPLKKLINAVDTVLTESLDGFVAAHADILALGDGHKFVRRRHAEAGQGRADLRRRLRPRAAAWRPRRPRHARRRLSRPGLHLADARPDDRGGGGGRTPAPACSSSSRTTKATS